MDYSLAPLVARGCSIKACPKKVLRLSHTLNPSHSQKHDALGHVHAPANFGKAFAGGVTLNAVPANVDMDKVRQFLFDLPGVKDIHGLHIWSLSTTDTALTCHLVMPDGRPGDNILAHTEEKLREHFGICDVTLQIELKASTSEQVARVHIR